jgi:hypothetical protein
MDDSGFAGTTVDTGSPMASARLVKPAAVD